MQAILFFIVSAIVIGSAVVSHAGTHLPFLRESPSVAGDSNANLILSVGGGITEIEYNKIIDLSEQIYQPTAKANHTNLYILRDWDSQVINAFTIVLGNDANISLPGGLARYPGMTIAGYAFVVCHELGHAFGGPPYIGDFRNSAEGQADYYAASTCLKELLPKLGSPNNGRTNESVKKLCGSTSEPSVCSMILSGGQFIMSMFSTQAPQPQEILDYSTPDTTVVTQTKLGYPSFQCRLDTILNGVLMRPRPACWFSVNESGSSKSDDAVEIPSL